MIDNSPHVATAFVTCSLRKEDRPFVDYVCSILDYHGIKPFGTVGKFSASPENPVILMKKNIPRADMLVVCATPRYMQRDISTGQVSHGLSEMVHVETGMAYAFGKPVVVFVQEGTNVGSFLPNISQYVVLDGRVEDYRMQEGTIYSLLNNAYGIVRELRKNKGVRATQDLVVTGLALYGGLKLAQALFSKE